MYHFLSITRYICVYRINNHDILTYIYHSGRTPVPSPDFGGDPLCSGASSSSTSGYFRLRPVPAVEQQTAPTLPRVRRHVPRATSSPVGGVRERCLPEQDKAARPVGGTASLMRHQRNAGGPLTADANGLLLPSVGARLDRPLRCGVCRL